MIRKKVYAVLTDKKMELFETSKPFSLPELIAQSPLPPPSTTTSLKFSSSPPPTSNNDNNTKSESLKMGGESSSNSNSSSSHRHAPPPPLATLLSPPLNTPTATTSQSSSCLSSSLSSSSSSSYDHKSANVVANSGIGGNRSNPLIMISENQIPTQYNVMEHQKNVGLLGKIYLCPQICGGRVQVARSDKRSFRILLTGESPKMGPELNMNKELLINASTPTSASTDNGNSGNSAMMDYPMTPNNYYYHHHHDMSHGGASGGGAYWSVMTPMFDPKSPHFPQSMHMFTSTDASSPQIDENLATPVGLVVPPPLATSPFSFSFNGNGGNGNGTGSNMFSNHYSVNNQQHHQQQQQRRHQYHQLSLVINRQNHNNNGGGDGANAGNGGANDQDDDGQAMMTDVTSPATPPNHHHHQHHPLQQQQQMDEDGDVTMRNAMSPHDDDNNPIYGTSRGKFEPYGSSSSCYGPSSSPYLYGGGSSDGDPMLRHGFSPLFGGSHLMHHHRQQHELQDILYFQADSEQECDEWLRHIQQVISSLNNKNAYLLDEILLYIFSFLDAFDLSQSIAPTSVKFYMLAQNELLWSQLYQSKWKKKEYSIMYYSAMLNVTAPYPLSSSISTNSHTASASAKSVGMVNRRTSTSSSSSTGSMSLVTWKYMYTKRFYCEKKYLKKESGSNESIGLVANNSTNNGHSNNQQLQGSTTNAAATTPPIGSTEADMDNGNGSEPLQSDGVSPIIMDPAEIERLRREEEEQRRRLEEERNKQISSEYLKDGNTLFNAADFEKDVQIKRLLWVFCIDQYDACLIYNPANWTAARNWAVALIRLEKLVNSYRGEVQAYLKMILELCVSKFETCMALTPNNDEVLTLWAGFLSDLALKIHDPHDSDKLFKGAHEKFQRALDIKPYIGTYNDYGISFCDMAEKKIRQLKRKLRISRSATDSMGNGSTSNNIVEEDEYDAFSDDEETMDEQQIAHEKSVILACLENSSKLYEKCLNIQPDYFHAINNMGFNQKLKIDLIRIGTKESLKSQSEYIKQERKRLVIDACDYFSRCVQIKDFVIARNNWGNILLQEAKEHEGEERFMYLQQCIEQYKRAMELEPSNDGCVCRCAIAYLMSAEIRLKDLQRAEQNWGNIVQHIQLLQQQQQQNSEELQMRLAEYLRLGHQQHEIVHQLRAQSQYMYEEASQGFMKLKNRGLSLYNLSCLNAVFNKEAEAQKYLREAFDFGYILTADKLKDDSDFDSLRDKDWFQKLMHDLCEREKRGLACRKQPKQAPFKHFSK